MNFHLPLCLLILRFATEPAAGFSTSKHSKSARQTRQDSLRIEADQSNAIRKALPLESAVRVPHNSANPEIWKQLVPNAFDTQHGVDVRACWRHDELPETVADRFLEKISSANDFFKYRPQLRQQLAESIETFTTFCSDRVRDADEFSGRIVSTRGPGGAKCPVWHLDHVPVRWIQTFYGPGVMYVDGDHVAWEKVNALDDTMSARERNRLLVNEDAKVNQVPEGGAVVLLGKQFNRHSKDPTVSMAPSVHKSPEIVNPWQGRVLMTMDVVTPLEEG
jgi:hypothetical protein